MRLLILMMLTPWLFQAQEVGFIPNHGQWSGDFDFRLGDAQSYVYLKPDEHRVMLFAYQHSQGQSRAPDSLMAGRHFMNGHVFSIKWIGANESASFSVKSLQGAGRLNYLLGSDRRKWARGLQQYEEVVYHDLYPHIDLRYYLNEAGYLAFDFMVHPGGNPELIKWTIEGVDQQGILGGNIALVTSVGTAVYSAPYSYQGEQIIASEFQELNAGKYGFKIQDYAKDQSLVIDPQLIFGTYSGSTGYNWGFAASYGAGATAYASGIFWSNRNGAFSNQPGVFPTTLGAFQDTIGGGATDMVIAKYSANGSQLLYGTYIGGNGNEFPVSLLEGPDESLYILGTTGSTDFPLHPNGHDTSFAPGSYDDMVTGSVFSLPQNSDIFLLRLDSTGSNLLGGTLLGDSASDGNNKRFSFNWGDGTRGTIAFDTTGNVIIASSTYSANLDGQVAGNTSYGGLQDGLVASFSPDLQSLNWSSYIGGTNHDATFSVAVTPDNRVFATGPTYSNTVVYDTTNVYQDTNRGKVDSYLCEIDVNNGDILKWTFTGTDQDDRAYFIDYSPEGNLVIFGQSNGLWPWVGDSVWGVPNSTMVLQEFSPDLKAVLHSTCFGDSNLTKTNMSPMAFMISDCGDIFLSGNGSESYAAHGDMGNSVGLPTSWDAFRDSADTYGDIYIMRLDASWTKLEYATFFGNPAYYDESGGGHGRISKEHGYLVQTTTNCWFDGFPGTSGSFSSTRGGLSGNCNMTTFLFDLEAYRIDARVELAPPLDDTLCIPAQIRFIDRSFNSSYTLIIDPRGRIDTLKNQTFSLGDSGSTAFQIIAIDTVCGLRDSSLFWVYGVPDDLRADFSFDYDSCDNSGLVRFRNLSQGASDYHWLIGDSTLSRDENPSYQFLPGSYTVQLISSEGRCGYTDSISKEITITKRQRVLDLKKSFNPCDPERRVVVWTDLNSDNKIDYQVFKWYLGDRLVFTGDTLKLFMNSSGYFRLRMRAEDTICNREIEVLDNLYFYDDHQKPQFPNVFSPNGDGLNDEFGLLNQDEISPFLAQASLEIYERRGTVVYQGHLNNLTWNGKKGALEMADGVYFYSFKYRDICGEMKEITGFVHLQR